MTKSYKTIRGDVTLKSASYLYFLKLFRDQNLAQNYSPMTSPGPFCDPSRLDSLQHYIAQPGQGFERLYLTPLLMSQLVNLRALHSVK